jgi:predicted DNA binding protein
MTPRSDRPGRREPERGTRTGSGPPPAGSSDRLAIMKLAVQMPQRDWLGYFTRRHPELVLESVNLSSVSHHQFLGEIVIHGPPRDWTREIAASPNVLGVENLGGSLDHGRYRVRFAYTVVHALAAKLGIVVRYPRVIANGILTVETVARLSQVRRLMAALARAGNEPRLISLRRNPFRSESLLLTPVQRALFRQALVLGYFDVPRRITLTELAAKVSRSKSSVSLTLATVERKIAEQFASLTES